MARPASTAVRATREKRLAQHHSYIRVEWDDECLELAGRLVAAGLWWKTVEQGEEGYGFHDWEERNPANEVDSGRFGNHLRWPNRVPPYPVAETRLAVAPSIGYSAIYATPPIRIVTPRASHSIMKLSCVVMTVWS